MDLFSYLLGKQAGGGGGGGGDAYTNIIETDTSNTTAVIQMAKTIENIEVSNSVTVFYNAFNECSNLEVLTFKNTPITSVVSFNSAFRGLKKITELDLSMFHVSPNNIMWCFADDVNLQKLDIRNFDFSSVTIYNFAFNNVPTNCEIIVKSNTEKTWINNNFPAMTNVKTVDEL